MNDYYFFLNEEYVKSDRNLKKKKERNLYLVDCCHLGWQKGRNTPETKDFIGN